MLLFYLLHILYKSWSSEDPWLKAYARMCNQVEETKNPAYLNNAED